MHSTAQMDQYLVYRNVHALHYLSASSSPFPYIFLRSIVWIFSRFNGWPITLPGPFQPQEEHDHTLEKNSITQGITCFFERLLLT
mmetsp:Transcript_9248/g.17298  ORF Transcript_9248/g.17298 Transcript_9248/m.17298 type:complete len:85 (+) Transcript_9248:81-335(+)